MLGQDPHRGSGVGMPLWGLYSRVTLSGFDWKGLKGGVNNNSNNVFVDEIFRTMRLLAL